jgi:drug/metabolite transporter (DMT)-like permease
MSLLAPAPSPGLRAAWSRLPGNVKGAAWLALAAAASASQLMVAKGLSGHIGSFETVLVRAVASLGLVVGLIPRLTWESLAPRRPVLLFTRSALATVSLGLLFYSVAHIPLADAQALNFSSVVFMIPLSVVMLGERVGPHRWAAAAIGFLGVITVLRPGAGHGVELMGAVAGAVGALLYGVMLISVRMVARGMTADATFVWGILGLVVLAAPLAALDWTWPSPREWELLAGVGALGAFAQYAAVQAYAVGEASAIAPVDYLKLVFAMTGGFLLFHEVPDVWTIVGAAAIVVATGYATYREAQRRREVNARGLSEAKSPN